MYSRQNPSYTTYYQGSSRPGPSYQVSNRPTVAISPQLTDTHYQVDRNYNPISVVSPGLSYRSSQAQQQNEQNKPPQVIIFNKDENNIPFDIDSHYNNSTMYRDESTVYHNDAENDYSRLAILSPRFKRSEKEDDSPPVSDYTSGFNNEEPVDRVSARTGHQSSGGPHQSFNDRGTDLINRITDLDTISNPTDSSVEEYRLKLDEHGLKLDEYGLKLDEYGLKLEDIDLSLKDIQSALNQIRSPGFNSSLIDNFHEFEKKIIAALAATHINTLVRMGLQGNLNEVLNILSNISEHLHTKLVTVEAVQTMLIDGLSQVRDSLNSTNKASLQALYNSQKEYHDGNYHQLNDKVDQHLATLEQNLTSINDKINHDIANLNTNLEQGQTIIKDKLEQNFTGISENISVSLTNLINQQSLSLTTLLKQQDHSINDEIKSLLKNIPQIDESNLINLIDQSNTKLVNHLLQEESKLNSNLEENINSSLENKIDSLLEAKLNQFFDDKLGSLFDHRLESFFENKLDRILENKFGSLLDNKLKSYNEQIWAKLENLSDSMVETMSTTMNENTEVIKQSLHKNKSTLDNEEDELNTLKLDLIDSVKSNERVIVQHYQKITSQLATNELNVLKTNEDLSQKLTQVNSSLQSVIEKGNQDAEILTKIQEFKNLLLTSLQKIDGLIELKHRESMERSEILSENKTGETNRKRNDESNKQRYRTKSNRSDINDNIRNTTIMNDSTTNATFTGSANTEANINEVGTPIITSPVRTVASPVSLVGTSLKSVNLAKSQNKDVITSPNRVILPLKGVISPVNSNNQIMMPTNSRIVVPPQAPQQTSALPQISSQSQTYQQSSVQIPQHIPSQMYHQSMQMSNPTTSRLVPPQFPSQASQQLPLQASINGSNTGYYQGLNNESMTRPPLIPGDYQKSTPEREPTQSSPSKLIKAPQITGNSPHGGSGTYIHPSMITSSQNSQQSRQINQINELIKGKREEQVRKENQRRIEREESTGKDNVLSDDRITSRNNERNVNRKAEQTELNNISKKEEGDLEADILARVINGK